MSWRVFVRPAAQGDFEEIYDWNGGRREGLGEEFREALRQLLGRLADSPRSYAVAHQSARRAVRHAVLERFPYVLFFTIEPDQRRDLRLPPRAPRSPLRPRAARLTTRTTPPTVTGPGRAARRGARASPTDGCDRTLARPRRRRGGRSAPHPGPEVAAVADEATKVGSVARSMSVAKAPAVVTPRVTLPAYDHSKASHGRHAACTTARGAPAGDHTGGCDVDAVAGTGVRSWLARRFEKATAVLGHVQGLRVG